MRETFSYYIDAIVFAALVFILIKTLTYFEINFNYIYVIVISLILFIVGKMILRIFINKNHRK